MVGVVGVVGRLAWDPHSGCECRLVPPTANRQERSGNSNYPTRRAGGHLPSFSRREVTPSTGACGIVEQQNRRGYCDPPGWVRQWEWFRREPARGLVLGF